jgi:hypothetical protein
MIINHLINQTQELLAFACRIQDTYIYGQHQADLVVLMWGGEKSRQRMI